MTRKRSRARSVLQVEDFGPTQWLRTQILQNAGYRVVNVTTVREALAAMETEPPDVVLCDVNLPDGTGFQVCREVQALQPGLPVIMISAIYRDEALKGSAVYNGASEYLVEPISAQDLVSAVTRQIVRSAYNWTTQRAAQLRIHGLRGEPSGECSTMTSRSFESWLRRFAAPTPNLTIEKAR